MPKYRTIVNGMNGIGAPALGSVAPEIPEGHEEQQVEAPETGGTFTGGMRVTEDVKTQIEHGSAADFFYFEEAKDEKGKFDMHPKLPEYGCDGPGKPVFKLRENNNRLMKGFAQKFLGADGEPDLDKGMKFLQEWNLRFGMNANTIPYSPEMPMERNISVLRENAHNWLCEELDIPDAEREDFKNYLDASMSFYIDQKAINFSNTYNLWQGFARNLSAAQKMQSDPNSPYFGDKGKDDPQFQLNLQYIENTKKELKRLAEIDPAKEISMIVPYECKGSQASNMSYVQLSDNAQVERGQKNKEDVRRDHFYIVEIENELIRQKKLPLDIENRIGSLMRKIEKETDPAKREEMVQRMQDLSVELLDAREKASKLPKEEDLKWNYHQAPVLGSFTVIQDGQEKKFYLTAEAFAQGTDVLMEHPAVTDSVGVGVYADMEDFRKFYRKGALLIDNEYSAKMAKYKEEYASAELDRLVNEEDEYRKLPLQQIDEREQFIEVYKSAKQALGDGAKEMTADQKAFEQQIAFMREGRGDVPEEQKADYEKLITMSSQLLAKSTALEYNRRITDKAIALLPTMEEKHAFTVCMEMNPASASRPDGPMRVMQSAIRSIKEGRGDFSLQGMSEQDAAAFHAFLKGKGMDPDRFVAAVNNAGTAVAQKMSANENAYDFKVNGKADQELQGFAQALADADDDPEMRRAGGAGLDLRANTGLMALNRLVGADLSGGIGGPNIQRMKAAMDRVVINGIPATALFDGEVTKENWKEAAALIGEHVSRYLREAKSENGMEFKDKRTEHVGILDNGKIIPLTYMPPEPVAPTTKVGFFSGRRLRNMRRLEEERYKEALARKEFWQKRNAEARKQSKVFEKLRAPQGKNNAATNHDLTFMDLVDSLQKENKAVAKKTGEKHVVKNGPQAEHGKDVKKAAVGP